MRAPWIVRQSRRNVHPVRASSPDVVSTPKRHWKGRASSPTDEAIIARTWNLPLPKSRNRVPGSLAGIGLLAVSILPKSLPSLPFLLEAVEAAGFTVVRVGM
jgi:hypothetical protein